MIQLDASLLKVVLARHKDEFRNYNPSHTNAEKLMSLAKVLWTLAVWIIPKAEKCGMEAIKLMRSLATLEHQVLPECILLTVSEHTKVLNDYNLTQSLLISPTRETELHIHSKLLMDVIRERNAEDEQELLRDSLKMLIHIIHASFPSVFFTTWSKALEYPELVREFKKQAYWVCYDSYLSKNEHFEPAHQIRRRAVDKFNELFGSTDFEAIGLREISLQFYCLEDKMSPEDILRDFRQYRQAVEEIMLTTPYQQASATRMIHKLAFEAQDSQTKILQFAIRDRFSRDIIEESLEFSLKIVKMCISNSRITAVEYDEFMWFNHAVTWFTLTVKCLELLNVTSEAVVELLRDLLKSFLTIQGWFKTSLSDCIVTLAPIVFKQFSLELYIHQDYNVLFEELLIIMECAYEKFQECLSRQLPNSFRLEYFVHLIKCSCKLEKFDQIVDICRGIHSRMKDSLDRQDWNAKNLREYILAGGTSFLEIQQTIFTVATLSNVSRDVKVILLNESVIASRYLLFCCVQVNADMHPPWRRKLFPITNDDFPNNSIASDRIWEEQWYTDIPLELRETYTFMELGNLSSHIVKCHIELELFVELAKFIEEYENILKKYKGNDYIVAKVMINLGWVVTKNIEHEKALKCVQLMQLIFKTTVEHLNSISGDQSEAPEIKEKASEAIKFCKLYEK